MSGPLGGGGGFFLTHTVVVLSQQSSPLRGGAVLNLLDVFRDVVLILYGDRPMNIDDDAAGRGGLTARRLKLIDEAAPLPLPLLQMPRTHSYHS